MNIESPFTYRMDIKVRWQELDALNHVNNATYFTYFEDVRIQYMRYLGYDSLNSHTGFGPILATVSCDFKSPVAFPDTLSVGCGVTRLGNSSLNLDYDIYSNQQNKMVTYGKSVVVMVNYKTGKPVPIPPEVRTKIKEINVTDS